MHWDIKYVLDQDVSLGREGLDLQGDGGEAAEVTRAEYELQQHREIWRRTRPGLTLIGTLGTESPLDNNLESSGFFSKSGGTLHP